MSNNLQEGSAPQRELPGVGTQAQESPFHVKVIKYFFALPFFLGAIFMEEKLGGESWMFILAARYSPILLVELLLAAIGFTVALARSTVIAVIAFILGSVLLAFLAVVGLIIGVS